MAVAATPAATVPQKTFRRHTSSHSRNGTTSGFAKMAAATPRAMPDLRPGGPNAASAIAATSTTLALPRKTSWRNGSEKTRPMSASTRPPRLQCLVSSRTPLAASASLAAT